MMVRAPALHLLSDGGHSTTSQYVAIEEIADHVLETEVARLHLDAEVVQLQEHRQLQQCAYLHHWYYSGILTVYLVQPETKLDNYLS